MLELAKTDTTFLYRQVIDLVNENIDSGALRPGDRLPSLRKMSRHAGVSIPTVRQAYVELERQRRVESRPQSGFYVRHVPANDIVRATPSFEGDPAPLACRTLMERVYTGINNPELVPLGIANPTMAKPAAKALHRAMKRVMARSEDRSIGYAATLGEPALRRQIAYHYLDTTGAKVDPEHIGITNGGQEALLLALKAVASQGDVIAVETPTYHGLLELIDSLGMLAIEIETCPEEGVTISELERTLQTHEVKACMFSTTLSNPLGVTMPEHERRRLVDLLERYDTVLIEDDVYGDLQVRWRAPGARAISRRQQAHHYLRLVFEDRRARLPHRLGGHGYLDRQDRAAQESVLLHIGAAAAAHARGFPGHRRLQPAHQGAAARAKAECGAHGRVGRRALPRRHAHVQAGRRRGVVARIARQR